MLYYISILPTSFAGVCLARSDTAWGLTRVRARARYV